MGVQQIIRKRCGVVYLFALLAVIPFSMRLYRIIVVEGDFWRSRSSRVAFDSLEVLPRRGNILACDGKLLASSIPFYTLYMDFKADGLKKDTFEYYIDDLSVALTTIYTDRSATEIKSHLRKGYESGSRYYLLGRKKLSYTELKRAKTFPLFNKGQNNSGLVIKEQVGRKRPFGDNTMGARTIGGLYAEIDKGGKSGIEMYCDSLLRGVRGTYSRQKVAGRYRNVNLLDPVDGLDVKTTLDVNAQDITENALLKVLRQMEIDHGCAVVMEVETGEIKAMCNLQRRSDGSYVEAQNFAVSSQTQPGSTFKIASAMVALEAGVVDTSTIIDTENGTSNFYGKQMKDHNYRSGGCGRVSLNRGIQLSSNIAIAKVIDNNFKSRPKEFIDGLYRIGLNTPLDIEIPGSAKPYIKSPDDPTWSRLSLPWIAHGYEIEFPPIYVLTFYNAIANGGKMVKPFLIRSICKNNEELETFSTRVLNPQICSPNTLRKVQGMMVQVVESGTAKLAKSDYFSVAGKTGTAVDPRNGIRQHQMTFCGFFPADRPKYTIIVVAWDVTSRSLSTGKVCCAAFKDIAEQLYAQSPLLHHAPDHRVGASQLLNPITKDGNMTLLRTLLDELEIPYTGKVEGSWGLSHLTKSGIKLEEKKIHSNFVPDVTGMGAKDAVFLLENRGLKVRLNGVGSVYAQSIPAGRAAEKGSTIVLSLK